VGIVRWRSVNQVISAFHTLGSVNDGEPQLDVRHINRWRRHLVNAYEVKAGRHGVLCRLNCVIHV